MNAIIAEKYGLSREDRALRQNFINTVDDQSCFSVLERRFIDFRENNKYCGVGLISKFVCDIPLFTLLLYILSLLIVNLWIVGTDFGTPLIHREGCTPITSLLLVFTFGAIFQLFAIIHLWIVLYKFYPLLAWFRRFLFVVGIIAIWINGIMSIIFHYSLVSCPDEYSQQYKILWLIYKFNIVNNLIIFGAWGLIMMILLLVCFINICKARANVCCDELNEDI